MSSHPFATIGERETIPPTSHLEISLCDGWLPLIFQLVCCGARLNSRAPAFIPTNIKDTDMKSRFCRPVRSGAPGPSAVRSGAPESVLIGLFVGFVIIVARSHVTCVTECSGAASGRGTVRMRLRACAPVRFHGQRAGTGAGHYSSRRLAGPPRACACAGLFIMKQASVGIRVRRIPCASSYYKSRADWNPSAAGKLADWNPSRLISRADWNPIAICKLPDWIPSRIIPRSPRAGAPGRLLPAQDSVCV